MGHAEAGNDMSAVYREGVDDDRLKAVTDHVRQCLFPPDEEKSQPEPAKEKSTRKRPMKAKSAKPQVAASDTQP